MARCTAARAPVETCRGTLHCGVPPPLKTLNVIRALHGPHTLLPAALALAPLAAVPNAFQSRVSCWCLPPHGVLLSDGEPGGSNRGVGRSMGCGLLGFQATALLSIYYRQCTTTSELASPLAPAPGPTGRARCFGSKQCTTARCHQLASARVAAACTTACQWACRLLYSACACLGFRALRAIPLGSAPR